MVGKNQLYLSDINISDNTENGHWGEGDGAKRQSDDT